MDDQRFAFFSKAILYAVKRIVAHVAYSCEISRAGATTEGREWKLSLVAAFLLKFLQPMLCPKRLSGCRLRAHKVFRQQSSILVRVMLFSRVHTDYLMPEPLCAY